MILLVYFLFFSEEYGRNEPYTTYQYNLELFREIKRYLMYREQIGMVYFAINLLGNVVVFMPFGFLVPVLYREQRKGVHFKGHYFRSGLFVTFLGFAFSLVVETIQLVTKVGCFDVDDLCLNTFGVILGYICYYLSKKIIRALGICERGILVLIIIGDRERDMEIGKGFHCTFYAGFHVSPILSLLMLGKQTDKLIFLV